ncbi:MAG: dihydrolipoyl dehydrogenase [Opitutaceae bacterium]
MAESAEFDLVVIGGGPAGYAAAIRAGQLGRKVACVEMERAGGTCLNWGCIPSKALLKSAEMFQSFKKADSMGFTVGEVGYDFAKIIARSRQVSDQMAKGIEFLFKKNKVDYVVGKGRVMSPGLVEVTDGQGKISQLKAKAILIATGARARRLPGLEVDGTRIMTSREALVMPAQPKSIIIVGASAIGMEFAYFLNAFGTEVTLVEIMPSVLPVEDEEVSKLVARSFKKSGVKIHTGTKIENLKATKTGVTAELVVDEKRTPIEAEAALIAIGIEANLEGTLAESVKPEKDRGYLRVDDCYETTVKGIYAAGDIIGPPWLAHVATYEAIQAVNGIFGVGKPRRVTAFPGCTYCQPQVASIGSTEKKLKEDGIDYLVGKFPFTASGKAVAGNASEGFVKVLSARDSGEILGVHIVGAEATELIAEYGLAITLEATIAEIHETIHAHPTLSEALAEAAAATHNEAIHI